MTLTYNIPVGRNSTGFQKMLLANWVITTQTAVGSGVPFTVSAGRDVARYASAANQAGGDRPDWAAPSAACPDPSPNGAINKGNPFNYVKAACFQLAPDGYLGNVKPLIFTGPNLISTDMSLRKSIAVREGKNVTLSADMFNIFNRPNFWHRLTGAVYIQRDGKRELRHDRAEQSLSDDHHVEAVPDQRTLHVLT